MNKNEALDYLRKNPVFWSRLGFCYDPPILDENGVPVVFNPDFSYQIKIHDDFCDAGVKIHTCILHSGWVGVDKYDYSLCDRVLDSLFASGKVEYYIPRIKLNVPIDWLKENPEEVCVYENGPSTADGIRELVGTLKHDYLGYESQVGYYNANGWQDPRPNVGGIISNQSFSSEKWLRDAGEALRRLIDHLENSKYADKIIAYHICFGASGESMPWGRLSGKFGDYGISNTNNFKEWASVKYGSFDKALEVWGNTNGQIIPPSYLREKNLCNGLDFYKDEYADRWSIDYDEFMSETNVNAISHFAKIVKEHTKDKPVGTFYGYILYMQRLAYAGHLGFERLLKDPNIDFFAAPKKYSYSSPGEPGGVMAPAVTINRNKLWLDECDNRTHLTLGDNNHNASTPEETYTVQLRETCKNISLNSGLWYMDLGGGWYDDKNIMNNISSFTNLIKKSCEKKHKSVAEIVVIVDEKSVMCTHPTFIRKMDEFINNIMLCGAPVDIIYSFDIDNADFSNAKAIILLTSLCLDDTYFENLKTFINDDASVIVVGKSSILSGFKFEDSKNSEYPEFYINDQPDMIYTFKNGNDKIICASRKHNEYFISSYNLSVEELINILGYTNVDFYAPKYCTVYADNRIISFFPYKDIEFVPKVLQIGIFTDFISGEKYTPGSILKINKKGGIAFIKE